MYVIYIYISPKQMPKGELSSFQERCPFLSFWGLTIVHLDPPSTAAPWKMWLPVPPWPAAMPGQFDR